MNFPVRMRHAVEELPKRLALPYGHWVCADGREVLFNREYQPIWHRRWLTDLPEQANPAERIAWKEQHHFYSDGTDPMSSKTAEKRCLLILKAFHTGESVAPYFDKDD